MMDSTTKNKNRLLWGIVSAAFWFMAWQITAMAVNREFLIPLPLATLRRFFELSLTGPFWIAAVGSLLRVLAGFLLGTAAGTLLAVLTSVLFPAHRVLSPAISVIRATPVVSFIVLALIWLPTDLVPVFATFLMVLPILWSNVEKGIVHTDKSLLEMARVCHAGRTAILKRIYIPSVLPYFNAGSITALGLAWKAGIAAEVICLPRGSSLGVMLHNSKIYLETTDLFAWTLAVILLSMLLEVLLVYVFKRMTSRQKQRMVRDEAA